jgi:hypothetical protein
MLEIHESFSNKGRCGEESSGLLSFDENTGALHFDRIDFDGKDGGEAQGFAGADVESRAVAGTFDLRPLQLALIQRPAVVRADVGDRMIFAVHVTESDALSVQRHDFDFARFGIA